MLETGFLVYFVAPGNDVRFVEEISKWLPDMYSVPFLVRLESNIRWFFDAIINQTGFLLPIIWTLLAILLLKQPRKISNVVVSIYLISVSVISLFADKFMVITAFLREFYPVWGFVGDFKDWIPIVIFTVTLIITLVAMYMVAASNKAKAVVPIILATAAVGTIGAVCLSPTIYASNYRTLYVASVLLVIIIVILLDRILSNPKSLR